MLALNRTVWMSVIKCFSGHAFLKKALNDNDFNDCHDDYVHDYDHYCDDFNDCDYDYYY